MEKLLIYRPTFRDAQYCMDVARYRDKTMRELELESGQHPHFSVMNHFVKAWGEHAASKIFGIEWEAKLDPGVFKEWHMKHPALGPFEIKTNNFVKGNLVLRDHDQDWATAILMLAKQSWQLGCYLIGNRNNPGVQPIYALGHLHVDTGKYKLGYPYQYQRNGMRRVRFVVDRKHLRPPEELFKLVDGFNKIRKERQVVKSNGIEFRLSR